MQFKVYLEAQGPEFNPVAFDDGLDAHLKGTICHRKHFNPKGQGQKTYWESKQITVTSGYPEEKLLELIQSLEPSLKALALDNQIKISAQIIEQYKEDESPRGFYVCSELIQTLARLNADLDIDVVYDLQPETN